MKFFKNLSPEDFKELMAIYTITLAFIYAFVVTFCTIPKANQRFADIILGSLLTIVFGKILSNYFDQHKVNKPKDDEEV